METGLEIPRRPQSFVPETQRFGELVFTGNSMPAGLPGNQRKSRLYRLLRDNRLA
jgi:hypothetical protein